MSYIGGTYGILRTYKALDGPKPSYNVLVIDAGLQYYGLY